MKTSNLNSPGGKALDSARGRAKTTRAGSPGIRFIDTTNGVDVIAATVYVTGIQATEGEEGEEVFLDVGTSNALGPDAAITAVKDAGNPTFNFQALVENVIKVGSTYYCPYIDGNQDKIYLATASDRDGPWSAAGQIYAFTTVTWASGLGATHIYAPHLIEDSGTFYLFYSVCNATNGLNGYIGFATSSTVNGTYTDHGAAILAPGAGAAWDSRRVGEPSVYIHGGTWYMAYMGETTAIAFGSSEKLGIATAALASGPWTKAAGNPIDWGASGAWDSALMADPDIFFWENRWWMWYAGTSTGFVPAQEGFLYTDDPTDIASWTRHQSNPVLTVGASGTWDDEQVFRGGIWIEDGELGGVYTGRPDGTITNCKGGNFRLQITGVSDITNAEDVPIEDASGYFTATDVEAALAELAASIAALSSPSGETGHYEVIVSGTAPPVAVTNEAEDDWLYGFVPD